MLTIDVTEEDISKGQKGVADCCPIALAMRRKGLCSIGVTAAFIVYFAGIKPKQYDTPNKVHSFIFDFDNDRPVQPFAFQLTD